MILSPDQDLQYAVETSRSVSGKRETNDTRNRLYKLTIRRTIIISFYISRAQIADRRLLLLPNNKRGFLFLYTIDTIRKNRENICGFFLFYDWRGLLSECYGTFCYYKTRSIQNPPWSVNSGFKNWSYRAGSKFSCPIACHSTINSRLNKD